MGALVWVFGGKGFAGISLRVSRGGILVLGYSILRGVFMLRHDHLQVVPVGVSAPSGAQFILARACSGRWGYNNEVNRDSKAKVIAGAGASSRSLVRTQNTALRAD